MRSSSLDRVLRDAEALPAEDRAMLEELLRHRRIEAWRRETAKAARRAIQSLRTGKLKAQSVEQIMDIISHEDVY